MSACKFLLSLSPSPSLTMYHNDHQLEEEEGEEESYLVPSLLTDQLAIDDAVRPYDLVGGSF